VGLEHHLSQKYEILVEHSKVRVNLKGLGLLNFVYGQNVEAFKLPVVSCFTFPTSNDGV
jgi:hypothetical protein